MNFFYVIHYKMIIKQIEMLMFINKTFHFNYRSKSREVWMTESKCLKELLEQRIDDILKANENCDNICDTLKRLKTRSLEKEIRKALGMYFSLII